VTDGYISHRSVHLHAARAIMHRPNRIGLSPNQAAKARRLGRAGAFPSDIAKAIEWGGCEQTLVRRLKEKNIPFGRKAARTRLGVDSTKLYRDEKINTRSFSAKYARSRDVA